jgi:SET domain-containing protein
MLDRIEVRRSRVQGRGIFALQRLRKGQRIGRFEGDSTMIDGTYVLWLIGDDGSEIGIRGRNALRFLNHGDRPNAEFQDDELYVVRNVQPGAEVLIDYGEGWREDRRVG